MKILVTGAKGQLGTDLVEELNQRGHSVIGVDREELNITDFSAVSRFLKSEKPDAVIHCAAWTAVDAAEKSENEKLCRLVNKTGTENIAELCRELSAKMIYISTDYVFSGKGDKAWYPDDERTPLNVYGQTKYEGELAVEKLEKYFIVRTSWVFGAGGNNFVKTVLRLAKSNKRLSFVCDQFGSPTYTRDLSRLLADMVQTDQYGAYHASNEGICSWYEFTLEILKQAGIKDVEVSPIKASEFGAAAKRPENSRLNKDKLTESGFERLPDWRNALSRYLDETGEKS